MSWFDDIIDSVTDFAEDAVDTVADGLEELGDLAFGACDLIEEGMEVYDKISEIIDIFKD